VAVFLTTACFLFLNAQTTNKPTEFELIAATIQDYMDGTANGEPEKLRKVFHPDFNLYMISNDSLRIRSGEQYISKITPGEKANRIGRIISIDFEKDAAIAKAEIIVPNWRIFTDYFLLMKYEGSWKIVQKSYTWKPYPKENKQ
jgi:hypothetical protein